MVSWLLGGILGRVRGVCCAMWCVSVLLLYSFVNSIVVQ